MFKEYRVILVNYPFISIIVLSIIICIMFTNVLIFQNYAHKHPIILELFSVTPIYYSLVHQAHTYW